jgi:hypothetical protein
MRAYLERMEHKFSLFDAPLVYNFSKISQTENADLTKVFDDTLVQLEPVNAVVSKCSARPPNFFHVLLTQRRPW